MTRFFSLPALALGLAATFAAPLRAEEAKVFEIAWFKLVPGATEEQMLAGAQHVEDHFLPRFDGRVTRELMAEEGGEYWIDSIHWRSLGDFEKAAAEILTDEDGAAIMSLIDLSSMAWFHADKVQSWQAAEMPQGDGYTELQVFRLVAPGSEIEFMQPTTDEAFLEAASALQPLLAAQPGFADRSLFRTADGWWLDLIHWSGKEAATAAKATMMAGAGDEASPVMPFLLQIDPKSLKTFGMNQKKVW